MNGGIRLNKTLGWIIISSVSYALFVILILHVLQPDKDPAVNAISEYVDGAYGLLMTSVFFVQTVGSLGLAILVIRIRPKVRKLQIGGLLFIVAAFGDVVAGVFPADPISVITMTPAGTVHAAGGLMRFVALAIGLPLLSSVLRKTEPWKKQGSVLKVLGGTFVIVFLVTIFVLTPANLFGLGQRAFITITLVWMFFVGLPMIQRKGSDHYEDYYT